MVALLRGVAVVGPGLAGSRGWPGWRATPEGGAWRAPRLLAEVRGGPGVAHVGVEGRSLRGEGDETGGHVRAGVVAVLGGLAAGTGPAHTLLRLQPHVDAAKIILTTRQVLQHVPGEDTGHLLVLSHATTLDLVVREDEVRLRLTALAGATPELAGDNGWEARHVVDEDA